MEQNKGLGGSLVEVFDAALNLVKTEARVQMARVTEVVKAKGIGAVLLLASTAPLVLGLIFLILFVFYGLIRLGLGAWAAALVIAIFSFVVAAMLAFMGIEKLKADVPEDDGQEAYDLSVPYTAHADDLRYGKVSGSEVVGSEYIDRDSSGLDTARVRDLRMDIHGDPVAGHDNHGESTAARRSSAVPDTTYPSVEQASRLSAEHPEGTTPQGTMTQGKPSDQPGISVDTTPTYKEDMKKEGY